MSLPQPEAGVVDINLKRSIASSYPDFEARATTAWHEIIQELDKLARVIKEEGVNVSRGLLDYLDTSKLTLHSTFLRPISTRSTVYPKMRLQGSKGVELF
jgi:hypothetical protein